MLIGLLVGVATSITHPASEIDAAVAEQLGEGTIASPVDRRLQLPRCSAPLVVGAPSGGAVAVRCASPPWALRVALRTAAPPGDAAATALRVRAGEVVALQIERGAFRVVTQGTLLDAGSVGARVRVRTQRDRPPISGIVADDGSVRVER